MQDCKSMSVPMTTNLKKLRDSATSSQDVDSILYRQLIGSLMYLVHMRPDICYIVNALSQFLSNPKHIHWVAAKHVLIYVRGTITYGLKYTSNSGVMLAGYADSDWAGSAVDRKSTSGYCFSMGSAMISWFSRKQVSIAQSTTEAEYIAASDVCKEAVSLRKLLYDLFGTKLDSTIIHCDNHSCIKLSEKSVFHNRSKHNEMKYHFIRNLVQRGTLKFLYIHTDEQIADILTKPLTKKKFHVLS